MQKKPILILILGVMAGLVLPVTANAGYYFHYGYGHREYGHFKHHYPHYRFGMGMYRYAPAFYPPFPVYYPPSSVYYSSPAPVTVISQPEISEKTSQAQLYFYPKQGQSSEQQSRDRFECHIWARNQTGYDPVSESFKQRRTVTYASTPVVQSYYPADPITNAAGGAALGAVGGAIAGDASLGAAIGAVVGATAWALGGAGYPSQPRTTYQQVEVVQPPSYNTSKVDDYHRAKTACMEAREYTVR